MRNRQLIPRQPGKSSRFSWGRLFDPDRRILVYRLFRRDLTGKVNLGLATFSDFESRLTIARVVRGARNMLRNKVDEIDLRYLGVDA